MVTKAGQGHRGPGQTYAIAWGCEIAYAAQRVYADGVDLGNDGIAVPIGLHCRLCERLDCSQRAFPPLRHRLSVDEHVRGATPYLFETQRGPARTGPPRPRGIPMDAGCEVHGYRSWSLGAGWVEERGGRECVLLW